MDIVCRLNKVSVFIVSRRGDTEYITDDKGLPLLFGKIPDVSGMGGGEIVIREVILNGTIDLREHITQ